MSKLLYYLDLGYDGEKDQEGETDDIWEKKYGQQNFLPLSQQKKSLQLLIKVDYFSK